MTNHSNLTEPNSTFHSRSLSLSVVWPFTFSGQDAFMESLFLAFLQESPDFSLQDNGELTCSLHKSLPTEHKVNGQAELAKTWLNSLAASLNWSFFLGANRAEELHAVNAPECTKAKPHGGGASGGLFGLSSAGAEKQKPHFQTRNKVSKIPFSSLSQALQAEVLSQAFEMYFSSSSASLSRRFLASIQNFENDLKTLAPTLKQQPGYRDVATAIHDVFGEYAGSCFIQLQPPEASSTGLLHVAGEALRRHTMRNTSRSSETETLNRPLYESIDALIEIFSTPKLSVAETSNLALPHLKTLSHCVALQLTEACSASRASASALDSLSFAPQLQVIHSIDLEEALIGAFGSWIENLPFVLQRANPKIAAKEQAELESRYVSLKREVKKAEEHLKTRAKRAPQEKSSAPCKALLGSAADELTGWIEANPFVAALLSGIFRLVKSGGENVLCLEPLLIARLQTQQLEKELASSRDFLSARHIEVEPHQPPQLSSEPADLDEQEVLSELLKGNINVDDAMRVWDRVCQ